MVWISKPPAVRGMSRMKMTNEPFRQAQVTPGKGDTQKLNVWLSETNGQTPALSEDDTDALVDAPREAAKRQEFWLDTCRGLAHVQVGCAQVQKLYRKHGCRFVAPTPEQVRGVLDALDHAMPKWEKEHPELFYQTLELSFPELLIRR